MKYQPIYGTLGSDMFIDREALAKQGDNRIGNIRPSVLVWVCLSFRPLPSKGLQTHVQVVLSMLIS